MFRIIVEQHIIYGAASTRFTTGLLLCDVLKSWTELSFVLSQTDPAEVLPTVTSCVCCGILRRALIQCILGTWSLFSRVSAFYKGQVKWDWFIWLRAWRELSLLWTTRCCLCGLDVMKIKMSWGKCSPINESNGKKKQPSEVLLGQFCGDRFEV